MASGGPFTVGEGGRTQQRVEHAREILRRRESQQVRAGVSCLFAKGTDSSMGRLEERGGSIGTAMGPRSFWGLTR